MRNIFWQNLTHRSTYLFALFLLVVAVIVNFILQPNMLESNTLNSNFRVFLPLIFLAVGQAIVILGGGIDISAGSIVGIVNAVIATQVGINGEPGWTVLMM